MNELFNQQDFERTINTGVSLIDFNAPWCAPCRSQEPILNKLATYYKDKVTIASMNIDNNRETAGKLGIQSIPTLIIYKNGNEILRLIGLQSEEFLMKTVDSIFN